MAAEIITKEDLNQFREKLLNDIKNLLSPGTTLASQKWLKSYQVKNMLKISPGTLQTLRMNGTLKFTRVGSIIYYNYEDILKIMEVNKHTGRKD